MSVSVERERKERERGYVCVERGRREGKRVKEELISFFPSHPFSISL